jgi:hypothetical protein
MYYRTVRAFTQDKSYVTHGRALLRDSLGDLVQLGKDFFPCLGEILFKIWVSRSNGALELGKSGRELCGHGGRWFEEKSRLKFAMRFLDRSFGPTKSSIPGVSPDRH